MKKAPRLLDVATLAEEFGPSRAFWREVVAKGLLPVIRPPEFRRVLVERAAVERLIASWTDGQAVSNGGASSLGRNGGVE